jgi:hypothetical protein
MAYARSGPSSEVQKLQDDITREVNADAAHLARTVFGKPGDQPDLARVSDEQLASTYRRAYQTGDRKFLVSEAQRDPEQFLRVAEQLGVTLAPPQPAMPTASAAPLSVSPAQVPGPAGEILSQLLAPQQGLPPGPAQVPPPAMPAPMPPGPPQAPLLGP